MCVCVCVCVADGAESDWWKVIGDDSRSPDVNFNLGQYIIQRENYDSRHEPRQRTGHWQDTSRSADAPASCRTWRGARRADLGDGAPAPRERNTWELTPHRFSASDFPAAGFPDFPAAAAAARLVTGSGASNVNVDELGAVGDSSDDEDDDAEDVWIRRLPSVQSSRRRGRNAAGAHAARDVGGGCELKPYNSDALRTRTTPTNRLSSTRS